MKNVLIRDLQEKTVNELKKRADANNHSLNAEIKQILESAVQKRSKADIINMVNETFERYSAERTLYSDSAEDLRELRDDQ